MIFFVEFASLVDYRKNDSYEVVIARWVILTLYRYTLDPKATPRPLYIFETSHYPYQSNSFSEKVVIPGAHQLKVVFDSQCNTFPNSDFLSFHTDEMMNVPPKCNFSGGQFQSFELNHCDRLWFSFDLEDKEKIQTISLESYYGWKFSLFVHFPPVLHFVSNLLSSSPSEINMSSDLSPRSPRFDGMEDIVDDIQLFSYHVVTKSAIASLLRDYLTCADDFIQRFSGHTLCNLLSFPHVASHFLSLNSHFEYFMHLTNEPISLISLAYCLNCILSDRYHRQELAILSPSCGKDNSLAILDKLKELSRIGPIECQTYIAECLANIAQESSSTR